MLKIQIILIVLHLYNEYLESKSVKFSKEKEIHFPEYYS